MILRIGFYGFVLSSLFLVSAQQGINDENSEDAAQGIDNVVIYYMDIKTLKMIPQVRELLPTSSETNRVKQVIEWLTIPPEEEGLMCVWSETILLRDVFIVDGKTVVVDFYEDSVLSFPSGVLLEGILIHSLVNSLLESFPWFTEVWILRDGHVQETFLGHIDTEKPLKANTSLFFDPEPVQTPNKKKN